MATLDDAKFIQQRLGYSFQNEEFLLLALTAAGKGGTEDGIEKQGNSRLAHFGNYLMQFILAWVGFTGHQSREDTTILRTRLTSAEHCAKVAENTELTRCLKYDMRSGSKSAGVLRKALNATIAAVFYDSRDLDTVLQVVLSIGLFGHDELGMDPRLLSTDRAGIIESFRNGTRPGDFQGLNAEISEGNGLEIFGERDQAPAGFDFLDVPGSFADMPEDSINLLDDRLDYTAPDPERGTGADLIVTGNVEPNLIISGQRSTQRANDDVGFRAATLLSQYLEEERERCISHSIQPPEETFFTKTIEKDLRGIGKKYSNTCILVQVLIASPCAFATLRELASSYRMEDDARLWQVNSDVAAQARFNVIQHLDGKIAAYGVLRRYHILQLFQESVPAESRVSKNFINSFSINFEYTNRSGNPVNNAKSDITQEMIRAIWPNLHPSSGEYKQKKRAISRLRAVGERYHAMADRFQRGVLGLLPIRGLAKPFDMGISDNMIAELPDTVFNKLLDVLDRTQGDLLRKSSEAVMRLIGPLMNGTSQSFEQSHIETYELEDIMRHPKGSEELMNILDLV